MYRFQINEEFALKVPAGPAWRWRLPDANENNEIPPEDQMLFLNVPMVYSSGRDHERLSVLAQGGEVDSGGQWPQRTIRPLGRDGEALCLRFAALCEHLRESDQSARHFIKNFAKDFGMLGGRPEWGGSQVVKISGWARQRPNGEWEHHWHRTESLAYWVESIEDFAAVYREAPQWQDNRQHFIARLMQGCARQFETSPALDPRTADLTLEVRPKHLLGTIWLRFVLDLINNSHWSYCDYCGQPFASKRKSARYCSPTHKTYAARERRKGRSNG